MVFLSVLVRVAVSAALALVTLRYGVGLYAWQAANRLEKPQYETLKRLGRTEVRRYAPYIVAEATIKAPTMSGGGSSGFRACAAYLFGSKNKDRATATARPMAMTAPVRMVSEKDEVKVSFVMARNESLRSLPIPTDSTVRLKHVPAHTAAFVRFPGGRPTETLVAKKRHALDKTILRLGFRPAKHQPATLVYGYHDPFITPNFLRKNEVGVYVEPLA
mmetsp:Transcript_15629/g.51145  ORF Transcript_15629/g.51145 Transcript_15629/m.51145 type:complete len:218 (-) Transcript_15629:226-879(-)